MYGTTKVDPMTTGVWVNVRGYVGDSECGCRGVCMCVYRGTIVNYVEGKGVWVRVGVNMCVGEILETYLYTDVITLLENLVRSGHDCTRPWSLVAR